MDMTSYLVSELNRIGWPCWNNKYSNTVFFKRPSSEIVSKYNLANSFDERFGGNLSHVVVMQHVKKDVIDRFIAELESTMTAVNVTSGMTSGVVVSEGKKRMYNQR